jgi:ribA/ribD-fused uncharacterized protein
MAGGFPLTVCGIRSHTSEALYQACRCPHMPDVRREIISQTKPMRAKMKSRKDNRRSYSRPDWNEIEIDVMRWCLQVKLKQNWDKFANLLVSAGAMDIVEETTEHDRFWGAEPTKNDLNTLEGINALGRLLMEIRGEIQKKTRTPATVVNPLPIQDFLLYGNPIPNL